MKRNVLVVDDDESMRFVLSRTIEGLGCQVVSTDDGAEVPALTARQHFDLLLLDLYMPGMNGFEVLRQIRRGPATCTPSTVRVLVISGEGYPASMQNVKALGADGYLTKPVDVDALERTVRGLLQLPTAPRRKSPTSA